MKNAASNQERTRRLELWTRRMDAQARALARAARARNTERAYASDLRDFESFCLITDAYREPPEAETVARYFAWLAQEQGRKPSTIRRRLAGLCRVWDDRYGLNHAGRDETVRRVVEGILRTYTAGVAQARALTVEEVRRLSLACDVRGHAGRRDRALLLVGFAGGFRRSELVTLDVEHVQYLEDRLRVYLPHSKTDPRGRGHWRSLRRGRRPVTCPVRALRAWVEGAGLTSGPLFRGVDRWGHVLRSRMHPDTVWHLLRRLGARAGLEAGISPHSLRAGFVTSATSRGLQPLEVQRVTGHRAVQTLARYDRGDAAAAPADLGL
ncbi:MAG TPA: site-specific integrase [Candidatus Hydrogenedentes bacterium]|nr:site-specific integrase [Candidatus Hydrogenedentota bacterium]